jgi:hypothetical protein
MRVFAPRPIAWPLSSTNSSRLSRINAGADPGRVAMVRDAVVRSLAHEVDRVVGDVDQAKSLFLDRVVGVAVDECDVDLAVSQHL